MITNEDLFEKYGKDIIFLFKGDEPYVEALGSPAGVLIERDDKVLCNICEEWFTSLGGPSSGGHLRSAHNMSADEYKEMFGFNRTTPLCSRQESQIRREKTVAAQAKDPSLLQKAAMARENARKTTSKPGYSKPSRKKRMQGLNIRNACHEQMKQRYRVLQSKYGNDVGLNKIRVVDPGVEGWAVRNYGSWNKFKEAMGEPVDTSSYPKDKSILICDMREYIAKYNKLPWNPVTKRRLNDFPHSINPYEQKWGKLSDALLACGVEWTRSNNDAGYSEKHWSLDPEWNEDFKKSMSRLDQLAVKVPRRETVVDKTIKVSHVDPSIIEKNIEPTNDNSVANGIWTPKALIPGNPGYAKAKF